jgi:hypothetical protein
VEGDSSNGGKKTNFPLEIKYTFKRKRGTTMQRVKIMLDALVMRMSITEMILNVVIASDFDKGFFIILISIVHIFILAQII